MKLYICGSITAWLSIQMKVHLPCFFQHYVPVAWGESNCLSITGFHHWHLLFIVWCTCLRCVHTSHCVFFLFLGFALFPVTFVLQLSQIWYALDVWWVLEFLCDVCSALWGGKFPSKSIWDWNILIPFFHSVPLLFLMLCLALPL